MMHMVHQYNFDQELGHNLLDIIHIQAEEVISVQNQHQYMDQLTNMIWIFHTWEVTSVGYHEIINPLYQKVIYASVMIYTFVYVFSPILALVFVSQSAPTMTAEFARNLYF